MKCRRALGAALGAWLVFGAPVWAQDEIRVVLVLASGDSQSRLEAEQIEALRAELPPNTWMTIDYLDAKRINGMPHYLEYYSTLFYGKYQNRRLNAVVALNNDAIRVANHYRTNVFAGVPLVVCGSNPSNMNELGNPAAWTGVFCEPSVEKTIDLALALHPQTKGIHVVTDRTLPGIQVRQRLNRDVELGRFPVSVEIPGDTRTFWSLPLVLEYVRTLPRDCVVFFAEYSNRAK